MYCTSESATLHTSVDIIETLGRSRLWIDALCINQMDLAEKQQQIPRMKEIYGRADRVLVWLGENSSEDAVLIHEIGSFFATSSSLPSRLTPPVEFASPEDTSDHIGLLVDYIEAKPFEFIQGLKRLLDRRWFHRLWAVQEVALPAHPPQFLAGKYLVNFAHMVLLNQALHHSQDFRLTVQNAKQIRDLHRSTRSSSNAYEQPDENVPFDSYSFSIQFCTIHQPLYKLETTLIHDQIYAILGMCGNARLPAHLAPDYSKSFARVCWDYTRLILESTGNFRILLRRRNSLSHVPGWVADFSAAAVLRRQPCLALPLDSRPTFSNHARKMTFRGVHIGKCAVIYKLDSGVARDDMRSMLASLDGFLQETASFWVRSLENVRKHMADVFATVLWGAYNAQWQLRAISRQNLRDMALVLLEDADGPWIEGEQEQFQFFTMRFIIRLRLFSIIATSSSFFATCFREDISPLPGDTLLVPDGCGFGLLLRTTATGALKFLSGCGLVQESTVNSLDLDFEGATKEHFTIE